MQQCGRTCMMQFSLENNLQTFLSQHPGCLVFDFNDQVYDGSYSQTVLIGPEGGFCDEERAMMKPEQIVRFDSPLVLRSETAAVAIAGKMLL